MPSMTRKISLTSPLHRKIIDAVDPRIKSAERAQNNQHSKWKRAEESIITYIPETELDANRRTNRDRGIPAYTTMQIPYTYALVMSAHTYWSSVFFARSPVHQYMGRHGETEQQTQALEALIDYQISAGDAMGPYYVWLYDAAKYGLGVVGTFWDTEMISYGTIEDTPAGKIQTSRTLAGYEGNRVYNVSPFDFFPDPRVTVGQFQRGEFVFVKKRIAWNDIIRRESLGYYMNITEIKTSKGVAEARNESHSSLERPMEYGTPTSGKHPSIVEAYEFYIELIPSEWELGDSKVPEKWVFSVTQDLSIIFGAQPLGLIHNEFPFDILEFEVEAYAQYNRGIPDIISSLQNTTDWLVNSHFFNVRSVLNNLFLVDPTKVVMKDFENVEEGGFIRLKPEAFGQDLRTFFHQIPISDVTQQNIGDVAAIQQIGERVLGINDSMQGATSGGRKTATEIRTSTGFGVSRMKTVSEYMSATGFAKHSRKLVMTSQQYYSAEKKFRIVGTLAQEAGAQFVQVTAEKIAGFYDFVPVDGTLPIDRFAQANLWKEIIVNIARVPQIAQSYDIGRIFAWMAHLAGLKNINQFKLQVLPPGVGPSPGMVPLPGATNGASNPAMTGIAPPGAPPLPPLQ